MGGRGREEEGGESTLLPPAKLGGRSGWSLEQGRGGTQEASKAPPSALCSARAAPSHGSALLPGDSGIQTTAHCHVALRNPSSTADPQADYTHSVQSHRHHYGQSDTDYMCTIVLRAYTAPFNNYTEIGSDTKPKTTQSSPPDPAPPAYSELITSSIHARSPRLLHRNSQPFRRNLLIFQRKKAI